MNHVISNRATIADLLVSRSVASDAALVLGGAALTAAAAQLSIPAQPVPFTFQTLAVLLVGSVLGTVRGALSMLVYLLAGLFLPVYAESSSGVGVLFGATGGYLLGFAVASALVGFFAERQWSKNIFGMAVSFVLGNFVIYAFGVPVLAFTVFAGDFSQAVKYGLVPFLLWDGIKALIAAGLIPGVWALVQRMKK